MKLSPPEFATYFSYGLNIKSYIPLPDLVKTKLEADVNIHSGFVRQSNYYKDFVTDNLIYKPHISLTVRASKEAFCFEWKGLACCLVQQGSDVTIELDPKIEPVDFIPFITGPISAVLLHQRNQLVLHSSVVKINNKAVLFLGNKGYGKSTLAAHLQVKGHQLISDDLAPVSFLNGIAKTIPGHPQLRLLPDSVESIGLDPQNFPTVNSATPKRQVRSTTCFSIDPVEIACVFVLKVSDEIGIAELSKPTAFVEIARNSYLNSYIEATENTSEHFQQCNSLVSRVPVFYLNRPRDYSRMDVVTTLIEHQASELFS